MSINPTLNALAERTLIACDASYFTNVVTTRPAGDTDPTHLYVNDPLAPLNDTPPNGSFPPDPTQQNYQPPFAYASLTQGYSVTNEITDPSTGFKCVVFQNTSTQNAIVSFGGTDGSDVQDWKGNLFSWGYSSWAKPTARDQVFQFLDNLPRDPTTHQLIGTISFTGQSLGGALAQYAVYEWLTQDTNRGLTENPNQPQVSATDDASHITLTTFNALGGVYALQQHDGFPTTGPTVLDALQSAANFVVLGDVVSRLGGGFAAGSIYQLNFPVNDLNQDLGLPYSATMGPVASHRIETGFYANLPSTGFAGVPDSQITVNPQNYVLASDQLTNAAALLGKIFEGKASFAGANFIDLVAGGLTALAFSDPVQLDKLLKVVWDAELNTGHLSQAQHDLLESFTLPAGLALKPVAAAFAPIAILAGMVSDLRRRNGVRNSLLMV